MRTMVILHNIRSEHNVGSVFRTADGAGVERIYLTGYTPCPIDRFGRAVPEIQKTALGATNTVSWEHVADTSTLISKLKAEGIWVVAVEQDARAVEYTNASAKDATAYIFGNEIEGVDASVIDLCDEVVHIPMHGVKESLNVSVTAGIILFNAH